MVHLQTQMKTKCLTLILLVAFFASVGRSEGTWTYGVTIINDSPDAAFTAGVTYWRTAYNSDRTWGGGVITLAYTADAVGAASTKVYGPYIGTTGTLIPGANGYYAEVWFQIGGQAPVKYGVYHYEQYNMNRADVDTSVILHVNGNSLTAVGCVQNLSFTVTDKTAYGSWYGIINTCEATPQGANPLYDGAFVASGATRTFHIAAVPCDETNCYVLGRYSKIGYYSSGTNDPLHLVTDDWQKVTTNSTPFDYTENQTTNRPIFDATGSGSGSGTNGGILFSMGASTNITKTIMEGSDALYDAVTKAGQQTHSDLLGLSNAVSKIGSGSTNGSASGTNSGSLSLTNYATESTQLGTSNILVGISNLLAGVQGTNDESADLEKAKQQLAKSAAQANSGSNSLLSAGAGLPSGDPLTTTTTYGDSGGVNWVVEVPYLGVEPIDLNPMHNDKISAIAVFMRAGLKWACIVSLLVMNCSALMTALNSLGATRQASAASAIPVASAFTAVVFAGVITGVMLAVPAFAASQFVTFSSSLAANPFSGASGIVSASVWLADQFFPLAVIVACPIAHYSFRLSLGAIVWGVQTATRFLVG